MPKPQNSLHEKSAFEDEEEKKEEVVAEKIDDAVEKAREAGVTS